MLRLILCTLLLFNIPFVFGQNGILRFNNEGIFKVVQFTDIHYKYDNQPKSKIAIERINEVLDAEKPDFVIFTGDVVVSNEAFKGLDIVLEPCIKRNIPFGVVFGNHDDEYDKTRVELYDYIASKKCNIMPRRSGESVPDYVLTVKSSKGNKDAALLYCIDSNSYTKIPSVPGYDWIRYNQIGWYRDQSRSFTTKNGGEPLPALAFFHIALPEYNDAVIEGKNRMFGVKGEKVCCPTINSGMFCSMKESGDVMGMFVGHDHDNDYAVMYKDILLAYGRYTGGNTVYNHLPNGARIIILREGERKFDSYIRTVNGIESRIKYPDSF
ncbi:MAG: metallophosphoesterase family protein [Muribaculaceae bacterium]|nr:metallophosphoesterase family protein [Muribaculaceae bacterium]